jgi:hypothetical protein
MNRQALHLNRTRERAAEFQTLFGTKPAAVFPHHQLQGDQADGPIVDVFVYPLSMEGEEDFVAAVTNGLTDEAAPSSDADESLELIQYLPTCTPGHALRLLELARLPAAGIPVRPGQIIAGLKPIVPGTPWTNVLLLHPPIEDHQSAGRTGFLWVLPISDRERDYAQREGTTALLARMDEQNLPIIFDEDTRREAL